MSSASSSSGQSYGCVIPPVSTLSHTPAANGSFTACLATHKTPSQGAATTGLKRVIHQGLTFLSTSSPKPQRTCTLAQRTLCSVARLLSEISWSCRALLPVASTPTPPTRHRPQPCPGVKDVAPSCDGLIKTVRTNRILYAKYRPFSFSNSPKKVKKLKKTLAVHARRGRSFTSSV